MRIKFKKNYSQRDDTQRAQDLKIGQDIKNRRPQREFLKRVLEKLNCPSLKELSNRVGINYSSLKNYFNEERTLPENLFDDLCFISKIEKKDLKVEFLDENYGKVIGGKKLGNRIPSDHSPTTRDLARTFIFRFANFISRNHSPTPQGS